MIRTQVRLTPGQARAVKRMARGRGASMAEIIRRSVDAYARAGRRPPSRGLQERPLSISGIAHGLTDLSERHDDYLAESLSQ